MPRPKPRSFRPVTDDLWHAAVAKAHARGTTVSAVINEALWRYVEGDDEAGRLDRPGVVHVPGRGDRDDARRGDGRRGTAAGDNIGPRVGKGRPARTARKGG